MPSAVTAATPGIHCRANPAGHKVYPYFTHPEAIVKWMGDYAVLDARPNGEFTLDINGVPVRGRFVELDPPHRLVISWGHAGSTLLPPGASTVENRPARAWTLGELTAIQAPR